jgi:hypothetical protein
MEMTQNFSFDKLPFDLSFLDIEKETNSEESFNPNNINVDDISIGKAIENIFNKNPFKEKDTPAHKKFELKYITKKEEEDQKIKMPM